MPHRPNHIALLRAVNVGGTGKLPMAELRTLAQGLGWTQVQTHGASGNLVFHSPQTDAAPLRQALEQALRAHTGRPACVVVMRSPEALQAVLDACPFPTAEPSRVLVSLLNDPLPANAASTVRHQQTEQIAWAAREVYVHYPSGAGSSKLRIAAAELGTARNLNTLRAVLSLVGGGEG